MVAATGKVGVEDSATDCDGGQGGGGGGGGPWQLLTVCLNHALSCPQRNPGRYFLLAACPSEPFLPPFAFLE